VIGAEVAAKCPPDGYTLWIGQDWSRIVKVSGARLD
jgi:hypothetical protein